MNGLDAARSAAGKAAIVERIFAVIAALVLSATALAQSAGSGRGGGSTLVAMRPSLELGDARAVTLADVAELSGPDAAKLGAIEIATAQETTAAARGVLAVDAQRVRKALDAAGVNWGRVSLRAVTTVVRVTPKEQSSRNDDKRREVPAQTVRDEPTLVDRSKPDAVRVAIADRLGDLLGVGPDAIKLGFKAQDARILDESTLGRVVDAQPCAGAGSGRIPVRVQVYEHDRLVLSGTVAVEVLVRKPAAIVREGIDRRVTIREDMLLVEERWLDPSHGTPIAVEAALGMNAKARLAPGEVLTSADLEAPVVVKRGEQVLVDCVSGGVVVQVKARAVRDGRDGEVVDFTPLNSKRSFGARMNGRGRAVMVVGVGVGGGAGAAPSGNE